MISALQDLCSVIVEMIPAWRSLHYKAAPGVIKLMDLSAIGAEVRGDCHLSVKDIIMEKVNLDKSLESSQNLELLVTYAFSFG